MTILNRISVLALIVCGTVSISVALGPTSLDERRSEPKVENAEPIVVAVDAKGRFKLGDKSITLIRLRRALGAAMGERIPGERIVYLKAGSKVSFSQVLKVLKLGRTLDFDTFGLILAEKDASDTAGAVLTRIFFERPGAVIKPNPLFLAVMFKKNGELLLNGESNTALSLTNQLLDIFEERVENGVYAEGTNEVEKSVFLLPSATTTFGSIVHAARVLQAAGAAPIRIDIDGPRPMVVEITNIKS